MTGTMPSIRDLLKFVKTADDPGGQGGPTAHATGKLDGQDGPLPSGETLKPKDTLLAEQSPATTPADAGTAPAVKEQLSSVGVTVYAADDHPEKPKTTVDDPGTSHAASTEKLAALSTAELTKLASAKCDDVLADLSARLQKTASANTPTPTAEKTAANAAAGYAAAAAVQPTETEKQAAATQYFEELTAYGLNLADRVTVRIKKAAAKLAAAPEELPPEPGMPPPGPPGMDPTGGAPPGMPPDMGAVPPGMPPGMPPDMGGGAPMPPGPPTDPMAGGDPSQGGPGGGLDLNEIINALIESGFTTDDIEQALAQVAQQTQAAPPTEEMPPEAKAAALREIDHTRKMFKAAKAYQRSGKAQIVPAADAAARTRRNQIKKYAMDLVQA